MITKIGRAVCIGFWLASNILCAQSDPFKAVNSEFDEQNPVISPDYGTLFFTRANHPSNPKVQRRAKRRARTRASRTGQNSARTDRVQS